MKKWRKRIKNNKGFVSVAARHNQNRERLVNRSQQREKSCFCVNAPQALIYLQAAGPFPVSGILRNCIEWRDNEMHLKRPENCKKQKKKKQVRRNPADWQKSERSLNLSQKIFEISCMRFHRVGFAANRRCWRVLTVPSYWEAWQDTILPTYWKSASKTSSSTQISQSVTIFILRYAWTFIINEQIHVNISYGIFFRLDTIVNV